MKKINKIEFQRRQKKREVSELEKRRNVRPYIKPYNVKEHITNSHRRKVDDIIFSRFKNELFDFLKESGFHGKTNSKLTINKYFSIEFDCDGTLEQLSNIQTTIHEFMGRTIEIDFSNCETTDLHAIFILRVIVNDYRTRQYQLQQKITTKDVITAIRVIPSKSNEVNKKLFAGGILDSLTTKVEQMMPISTIGFHTGERSQKHYAENKKGITATLIAKYVNENCLKKYECQLTKEGQNKMEAMIAEVLNNAEDHSIKNKWYATATLFEENRIKAQPGKDPVGELSITILNFGYSFYDGLEETKDDNRTTYDDIDNLYNKVIEVKGGDKFTKENYFTLFALQDGVSRLKYEREDRGTGTMKFINSFLYIGDYEDAQKKYFPHLTILTGKTLLRCDNKYRSFEQEGDYYISLNSNNDLSLPPDSSNLKSLKNRFPGTVLAVKVYLNKGHLLRKISENGKE